MSSLIICGEPGQPWCFPSRTVTTWVTSEFLRSRDSFSCIVSDHLSISHCTIVAPWPITQDFLTARFSCWESLCWLLCPSQCNSTVYVSLRTMSSLTICGEPGEPCCFPWRTGTAWVESEFLRPCDSVSCIPSISHCTTVEIWLSTHGFLNNVIIIYLYLYISRVPWPGH